MKILWLSNIALSEQDSGGTGTWLSVMAQGLIHTGYVELGNISEGKVTESRRRDSGQVCQWIVPSSTRLNRDGLPDERIIAAVIRAVEEFSPDLVHVWGTECYWGLLTARKLIDYPNLLEMQGLKSICARVFHGGLSFTEMLACIGFKEMVRRSTIYQAKKRFEKWGQYEKEIIIGHPCITTQSTWVAAWVKAINPSCRTFHNDLALRDSFHVSLAWNYSEKPVIFCSAAYPVPFKGLHVAVRAVALLKHRYPTIELRIAGALQRSGVRQDGYIAWLNRETKKLKIESNIVWLGALNDAKIVEEMLLASVMVLPTFIENCCAAMQEAMIVGVPLVASYVGGLPSLARDEDSSLFFPPGDEAMCAYQLERVFTDRELAMRLSKRAREVALVRNNSKKIVSRQLEIYRQVIAEMKVNKVGEVK